MIENTKMCLVDADEKLKFQVSHQLAYKCSEELVDLVLLASDIRRNGGQLKSLEPFEIEQLIDFTTHWLDTLSQNNAVYHCAGVESVHWMEKQLNKLETKWHRRWVLDTLPLWTKQTCVKQNSRLEKKVDDLCKSHENWVTAANALATSCCSCSVQSLYLPTMSVKDEDFELNVAFNYDAFDAIYSPQYHAADAFALPPLAPIPSPRKRGRDQF